VHGHMFTLIRGADEEALLAATRSLSRPSLNPTDGQFRTVSRSLTFRYQRSSRLDCCGQWARRLPCFDTSSELLGGGSARER
jgi:hypothetical protein